MKRNTGPSGGCQYAWFTKNLWKKDRQRDRERENPKKEMFYSGSPSTFIVLVEVNPLVNAAVDTLAHWQPQMAVRAK